MRRGTWAEMTFEEKEAMARELRRLRKRPRLVEAVRDVLENRSPSLAPLTEALTQLPPNRWRERMLAAWALGRANLSADQREEAVRSLTLLLERPVHRQIAPLFLLLGRAFCLALLPALLITFQIHEEMGSWVKPFLVGGIITLAYIGIFAFWLSPISYAHDINRFNRARAAAARALGHLHAIEGVGVLAAAARRPASEVGQAALHSLRGLLPALTPAHYGQLGPQTIPNLCRLLEKADPPMTLLLLQALHQVGDGSAIPAVSRLAVTGKTTEVQEAAQDLLPLLRERRRQEEGSAYLLRSSAPTPAPDQLLRAAPPTTDTPETLLRAMERQ